MTVQDNIVRVLDQNYRGQILQGNYSEELKNRLAQYIAIYRAFEKTANPAIPYIAAWHEGENEIWYEFTSKRLQKLLGCDVSQVADVFQSRILDRRVYQRPESDERAAKETASVKEPNPATATSDQNAERKGKIEAVYKISIDSGKVVWLKDLANVETYPQDGISLSLGCLTVVSKEMRAEEERIQKERLQVSLETAGAVCHELNQPIQSASMYAETILMNLPEDHPLFLKLNKILELTKTMGEITRKLARITKYETKDYVKGIRIFDIEKSSNDEKKE